MIIRLVIILSLLAWGFHSGGFWGAFAVFLFLGIIGPVFARHPEARPKRERFVLPPSNGEVNVQARRGRSVDPTRPNW